jgi:hypothetical protein
MVERLSSKCKAPSLNTSIAKIIVIIIVLKFNNNNLI